MIARTVRSLLLAGTILAVPAIASAQGTLSTQGFGYPTAGMSTRSLGTGGAITDLDPLSPTNPAAIPSIGGGAAYVQMEPEFRQLDVGAATQNDRIARHPLATIAFPVRSNIMAGADALQLSRPQLRDERAPRGDLSAPRLLPTTNFFKSDGAIADVRAAIAWTPRSWIRLGVGGHQIMGDNRLRSTQLFDDSARFAAIIDTSTITYVGTAVSAGATLFIKNTVGLAASYRKGDSMSVKHADTTLSKANVPDRMSVSLAYIGIRGTTIAARTSKETWTEMRGLGSPTLPINDTWDYERRRRRARSSIGAARDPGACGCALAHAPVRTATSEITRRPRRSGSAPCSLAAASRSTSTGIRAIREPVSSDSELRETAWTLSTGLTIRP